MPSRPFDGSVTSGNAVRIMTGAPMPAGADAVLPIENAQIDGERVLVMGDVSPGKHVGQVGEDVRAGDVVARSGLVLRPQDVGLLSSLGFSQATVVRRPRVRILITGNELLPMGTPPIGYQITDANGPMLAALVERDGGEAIVGEIVPDDRVAILAAMRADAEVVLVSGGSSVGEEDHAPTLLAEHGELAIHGIAMRPSSPTGMGRLDDRLVFLLPGNPVSCLCAYDFFAGRAIRALGGRSREWPYRRVRAVLARKLVSVVGRIDYARVHVDGTSAEPVAISGASVLSSTTRADGFVVIPTDSEGYPEGAEVDVFLYQ
jgi:molybdopterin molybdotransferase